MGRRLTIFSRLTIGYLTVLMMVMAVSIYSIMRLHELNTGVRNILDVDTQILEYEEKLVDAVLSQIRYEKKYLKSNDPVFHQQFLSAGKEFDKQFEEVLLMAGKGPQNERLEKIKKDYARYQSLVGEEFAHGKANRDYPRKWYETEKEKVIDELLTDLEKLETDARHDVWARMNLLRKAGLSARKVSIIIAIVAVVLVVAVSLLITSSITKPLALLKEKTREISLGVFKGDLNIPSPPEISELAKAFNTMCEKLSHLDEVKSDFFSFMSHELRTPLTSIKEGISLLESYTGGRVSERERRLLGILTAETNRLISLVNSVLDLSKMEAGMMPYHFERRRLAPLIEAVLTEMVPLVHAKRIQIEPRISKELPVIRMDSEKILQVLRNLIGNAVKFTPEGGQVKVSARPTDEGVEVSVTDTGPGIPPGSLAAVFDKFSSSDQSRGTGLGLAIVRHIITDHGGKVWAENAPGRGSTFIFLLSS